MTPPCENTPVIEWFSQTDVLALQAQLCAHARAAGPAIFTEPADSAGKFDPFTSDFNEVRARMRSAGFGTLNYGAYEMIGSHMLYALLLRDFAPFSFMQAYFEGAWYEVDPRIDEVRQSGLPVVWSVERIDAHAQRSGERRLAALAASLRAHAMNSGVMFNLSAPQLEVSVGVGLSSEVLDCDWINDRVIGTAFAISLSVHRFAQPYLEARVHCNRAIELDGEQEAVLAKLVQGLADQEIADAMHLSLHKVGYHIQALERVFNVQNRAQLAYLAARRSRSRD